MNEKMTRGERRERWRALVQEHEQCGLSARAFCKDRNLSYQSFLAWRKRFAAAEGDCSEADRERGEPLFSEVTYLSGAIEVVLGAVTVRVPPGFPEGELRAVLREAAALARC